MKHKNKSSGSTATAATVASPQRITGQTWLTADDLFLFNEGTHYRLYDTLGCHVVEKDGVAGAHFAVWAPNAEHVSVIGESNGWDPNANPLQPKEQSGIWEGFVSGVQEGMVYKYRICSRHGGYTVDKADPVGFMHQTPPKTASIVHRLDYSWGDAEWMRRRGRLQTLDRPMSIYEVHLGSWRRVPEKGNRSLTYREIAPLLSDYVRQEGFTHVEFLPLMEHPFYGSWGYQVTGYFAPTSRYGTPQDFMFLIDYLHQQGIGVILDWVPSHFPTDEHGLAFFDGTYLFEHANVQQGFHPHWKSSIFNYGRHEVRSFLASSAVFWLDKYHADGLRVDAVASMLYLDYGRAAGEWVPNRLGGRENLEAIDFLRQLNTEVYRSFPDVQTIAEESTAWPQVSRPAHVGGLGFGLKWDMGWMHDSLEYLARDPVHRKYHHNALTFRRMYQSSENYVLPLSHDEVVHLKGSLFTKMSGDDWQRFANLRLLLTNQWLQPGKKLLFMGSEFGQRPEWSHDASLDWHLVQDGRHQGIQRLVRELNRLYRDEPALHEGDCREDGFEWINPHDADHSVVSFMRCGTSKKDALVAVFNYTPVPFFNYRLGTRSAGIWQEIFNSDAAEFGGSGHGNLGQVEAAPIPWITWPYTLTLTLPPLGALLLKPVYFEASEPSKP